VDDLCEIIPGFCCSFANTDVVHAGKARSPCCSGRDAVWFDFGKRSAEIM
jgi:hypothetical protein